MCFGESLYYTNVDYKWLESEISWDGACVWKGGGVGAENVPVPRFVTDKRSHKMISSMHFF